MKIFYIMILFLIVSCGNDNKQSVIYKKIDIEKKMTFNEYRELIEKSGKKSDYPDIDQWKKILI